MNTPGYYINGIYKRFHLNISLWKAVLNFFGLHPNLYSEAVEAIAQKSTKEALMSDLAAIRQDANKVIDEKQICQLIRKRVKTTVGQD